MTTRTEQDAAEIAVLRSVTRQSYTLILQLLEDLPEGAHLETRRGIYHSVIRCLADVSGYVAREAARREARDDRA